MGRDKLRQLGDLRQSLVDRRCQPCAVAQLEEVHEELDIDETPAHQLDVERPLGRFVRCHLVAHFEKISPESGGITLCAQHIGKDSIDLADRALAPGQRARTGQRHMFPRPGVFPLVARETLQIDRQRPLRALRPQPRIDLVKRALRRRDRKRRAHPLCKAIEIERGAERPFTVAFAIMAAGEHIYDVEVRGIGQRAAPQAP